MAREVSDRELAPNVLFVSIDHGDKESSVRVGSRFHADEPLERSERDEDYVDGWEWDGLHDALKSENKLGG